MKWICFYADSAYMNDALFDRASRMNRDDCLSPFILLRDRLSAKGYECHTQDRLDRDGGPPAAIAFVEMPRPRILRELSTAYPGVPLILFLFECEVIKPDNWREELFGYFKLVFTWKDSYVDGKKYHKIRFPVRFPDNVPADGPQRERMFTMISANKSKTHPLELYSERRALIEWFETFQPENLDLYGIGWDRPSFSSQFLNRIIGILPSAITSLFARKYKVYRGPIALKLPVLSKYRFAFCYENAKGIPGYITEKIFDGFFAGCVPVYMGASDIREHIPASCFIDKEAFPSTGAAVKFMNGLTEKEYSAYLENIRRFLNTPEARAFSDVHFSDTVSKVISDALPNSNA